MRPIEVDLQVASSSLRGKCQLGWRMLFDTA